MCGNSGCEKTSFLSQQELILHNTFERNAAALVRKLRLVDAWQESLTNCEIDLVRAIENDFLKGIFHFPCMYVNEESGKACQIACHSPLDLLEHQKEHIGMSLSKKFPNHGVFTENPVFRCPLQCLVIDMEAGGVCLHVCKDELELEVHRSEHINGIPFTDIEIIHGFGGATAHAENVFVNK
jgi:hypothetical protein